MQLNCIKTGDDLRYSGRVSRSCFSCGTRRVANVITNPVNILAREHHLYSRKVKLKDIANFIFFILRSSKFLYEVSFVLIKKQVGKKRAQLIPIGMSTVCWKTRPPNVTNMLSIKHLSENFLFDPLQGIYKVWFIPS